RRPRSRADSTARLRDRRRRRGRGHHERRRGIGGRRRARLLQRRRRACEDHRPGGRVTEPDAQAAPTYESATARLEQIIKRLDSGEAGLRETLDLCREGRTLVEFCAGELEAVGHGLEELRLDALVERLEADMRQGGEG